MEKINTKKIQQSIFRKTLIFLKHFIAKNIHQIYVKKIM